MRDIVKTSRYLRDMKRLKKRGFNPDPLAVVVSCLSFGLPIPYQFKDHPLKGEWKPSRECHLGFDLILVYEIKGDAVLLQRIGTHSEVLNC